MVTYCLKHIFFSIFCKIYIDDDVYYHSSFVYIVIRNKNTPSQNLKFLRFGSLIYEVHLDRGIMPMLYYVFYLLHRLIYALPLFYLTDYPFIQGSANLLISIALTVYVIIYKPFV